MTREEALIELGAVEVTMRLLRRLLEQDPRSTLSDAAKSYRDADGRKTIDSIQRDLGGEGGGATGDIH